MTTKINNIEYNTAHLALSRRAAAEGAVLLKNENNVLPLSKEKPVALFGRNQFDTFKGGGGAADLWVVPTLSFADGMNEAGNVYGPLLKKYRAYSEANLNRTLNKIHFTIQPYTPGLAEVQLKDEEVASAAAACDAALIFIGRFCGEGFDIKNEKGDYMLTDEEERLIASVTKHFEKTVLVLNLPGPMDLSFLRKYHINAIIQMFMPGMEAGHALADIVYGDVSPCGKLPHSWCETLCEYPTNEGFATEQIIYSEGIYMGYRYFDTFKKDVTFPFGFGLSYTSFEISPVSQEINGTVVTLRVKVINKGERCGRETVQLYVSIPDGELDNPYQVLCAFAKTKKLNSGESEILEIKADLADFAPYSERLAAHILEKGDYIIRLGNSSDGTKPACIINLAETVICRQLENKMVPPIEFTQLKKPQSETESFGDIPVLNMKPSFAEPEAVSDKSRSTGEAFTFADVLSGVCTPEELAKQISDRELCLMLTGDGYKKRIDANIIPNEEVAAGEGTHTHPVNELGIPPITMQDGPNGVRACSFGNPLPPVEEVSGADCICYPSSTMLAATWDVELLRKIGEAITVDMERCNFNGLCAPGVNLHRNPLCGRNFEYYSEDPLLSAEIASALINGVQKKPDGSPTGRYAVVKHLACNNSEEQRMTSDSIVSERALRELYLKVFELTIKKSNPHALMTSYNKVNGEYAAARADLLTDILKKEWAYDGWVMSDWEVWAPALDCIKAGIDTVMPGVYLTPEDVRGAGISREEAEERVTRLIRTVAICNKY